MSQSAYASIAVQGIYNTKVNSTTTITTTSGTDAVMTSMTLTPIAGTYLAFFSGTLQMNISGDSITTSFYVNGVKDTTSVVDAAPFAGGTLTAGQASVPWVNIGGPYTVNGAQAIDLRWHVSGGTGTSQQRQLFLLKVG